MKNNTLWTPNRANLKALKEQQLKLAIREYELQGYAIRERLKQLREQLKTCGKEVRHL